MKNLWAITASMLCAVVMTAQGDKLSDVETLYQNLGYGASLEVFKSGQSGQSVSHNMLYKVADSYRLTGDTRNAEFWYGQAITEESEAVHILRYAQVLQSNEKYDQAKEWFLQYQNKEGHSESLAKTLAEACDKVSTLKNSKDIDIKNVVALNTAKLDFSPVYYKEGLVFTSTRGTMGLSKNVDSWINDNFMDLFYADSDEAKDFDSPKPFIGDINSKYHDGTATFNKAGTVMYFARNNYHAGKRKADKKGVTLLKIYATRLMDEGEWGELVELPFNSDEFTSCHPTLSADGRQLFFASDRPDGYGGLDLYVSNMKGGQWGEPINLGPSVNTEGNEIFPFIHDDGTLYFASTGHTGFGGLDIFATSRSITDETGWTFAANLGKPFNSSQDDFGFIADLTGSQGYFTSNRAGGMGGDDIYSFQAPENIVSNKIKTAEGNLMVAPQICVYDEETGEKIGQARVLVRPGEAENLTSDKDNYILKLEPLDEAGKEYTLNITQREANTINPNADINTDLKGYFSYTMDANASYVFEVIKEGYETTIETIDLSTLSESEMDFCIPLRKKNCLLLSGNVINKNYKNEIPNASVKILNKCTGEVIQTTSDRNGNFELCLECGCDYSLVGIKNYFWNGNNTISTRDINCEDARLDVELALVPKDEEFGDFFAQNSPAPNNYAPAPQRYAPPVSAQNYPTQYDPFNTGLPYREGMVIELKKIYYDFDQHFIRSEAGYELDKLVTLLNNYPTMEIELSSHTDSRGSNAYNEALSQRRAQAAVEYLIQHGITASRVQAKGYGEKMPRNQCRDFVLCSEEAHQANRRTEVKITRFDQQQHVKVKYQDNQPQVIDRAPYPSGSSK